MKTELLDKIFNCKWNVTSNVDEHIIGLFYYLGGFSGLLNRVEKRKVEMKNEFNVYFSSELIDLLTQAKEEITDYDFKGYAIEKLEKNRNFIGKKNFITLDHHDLLHHFESFSSGFRGTITEITKISDFYVFETRTEEEISFRISTSYSMCFRTIEEAIIYQIFNGKYQDTLTTLLKASK